MRSFDFRVLFAVLASIAVSMTGCTSKSDSADARLKAIYTDEWKWREEQFPDNEDSQKPDSGSLAQGRSRHLRRRASPCGRTRSRKLDAIPRDELSPAERINYEVYRPQIETLDREPAVPRLSRCPPTRIPRSGPTSATRRAGRFGPSRITAIGYRKCAIFRDIFTSRWTRCDSGLKRGFTPPRVTMTGRDASITAVTDARRRRACSTRRSRTCRVSPAADQSALRAQAIEVIRDTVQPAYRELVAFMRNEYLPGTRTSLAAYDLPDGKAYYRAKIREFTTLDRDPASIHAFGEVGGRAPARRDARRDERDADSRAISRRSSHSCAATRNFRRRPRRSCLMRAAWIAKRFDGKASQFFGLLPRARFAIQPVPDDLAPFYTAGRGGPGLYLLNTYDLPSRPLYNLTALTLHESAPGHAFQMPLAMEHKQSAGISPAHLSLGLRRRLGAVLRMAGPGDGHVRDALRALRHAELSDLARGAARGRYRHSCAGLEPRSSHRLPARIHGAAGA